MNDTFLSVRNAIVDGEPERSAKSERCSSGVSTLSAFDGNHTACRGTLCVPSYVCLKVLSPVVARLYDCRVVSV